MVHRLMFSFFFLVMLTACQEKKNTPLFTEVDSTRSNITFVNRVVQSGDNNVMNYPYYFNGGGVAVGDINNDGWVDVYFTGNQVANKLYLNKGDLAFEDITEKAGVAAPIGWKTGVTMADINQDGWLDIYVCRSAMEDSTLRENLLFINNKDLTFSERGKEYGLADNSYSTQAAFFDFDNDSDLDLFVLNHSLPQYAGFNRLLANHKVERSSKFGSKLFQNENGIFTDATDKAGLVNNVLSFGLGLAVTDINSDGWLDLYISNDFNEEDYLYINNRNGTFTNNLKESIGHVSLFSMGSDVADINNDNLPDLITLDMLPETNERIKLSSGDDNYDKYRMLVEAGFHPQSMRNMLQLNNGDGTFSEIGQYAGIANTDWSWSALLADFDGDGYKDLFVTNGYEKDYTNMQFLKYTVDEQVKARQTGIALNVSQILENMPTIPGESHLFKNNGNVTFKNMGSAWSAGRNYKANGAAYADLDNDGDIDLLANVMNGTAIIHQNQSVEKYHKKFFVLDLAKWNAGQNIIGTKVQVFQRDSSQYFEFSPTRGYQSCMYVPISIATASKVDSVQITWPDGKRVVTYDLNKPVFISRPSFSLPSAEVKQSTLLEESGLISWAHHSADVNDFKRQILLPKMFSYSGPAMAVGDVNADGWDDVYLGGAKDQPSTLFMQLPDGAMKEKVIMDFLKDKEAQDEDAEFVDVDKDGDLDLYVASGGYMFEPDDKLLQDRLYLNDGKGNFAKSSNALPAETNAGSAIEILDVNMDGYDDLFIGSSFVPGRYPEAPLSQLLINDGKGKFTNSISTVAPELEKIGMVTDALSTDLNRDGKMDLIVVGQWTNIEFFINKDGKLVKSTEKFLDHDYKGWWNCISGGDFDGDGDIDLLVGNYGGNSHYRVSDTHPGSLTFKDFNADGKTDPFFCYYIGDKSYPYASRDEALGQVNFLQKRFTDYSSYSKVTLQDVFTPEELKDSKTLSANILETVYLENKNGVFVQRNLPISTQFSPIHAMCSTDIDNDGDLDVVLGGNETMVRVRIGKSDASYGTVLINDGNGNFKDLPATKSGLSVMGDIQRLKIIRSPKNVNLLIGIMNHKVRSFSINAKEISTVNE